MFQSLSRCYNIHSNKTILTVYDSCFTAQVLDTCACTNDNCPQTISNLIKIYERKSLNVSKNVTSYLMWLAKLGWHAYDELESQGANTGYRCPELKFNTKYRKSIKTYMKSPIFTIPTDTRIVRKNGWSI